MIHHCDRDEVLQRDRLPAPALVGEKFDVGAERKFLSGMGAKETR
jgi:hypothetical protein